MRTRTIRKKTWPDYFQMILEGKKKFDIRLADFDVKKGDVIVFEEFDPKTKSYTGRTHEVKVTLVIMPNELPYWSDQEKAEKGFQVVQFEPLKDIEKNKVVNATLGYIVDDKNRVLMIHLRKDYGDGVKDFWNGVGGKLEKNESPEEGITREAKEECGLDIKNPKLAGILTFPGNLGSQDTWRAFVFKIAEYSGKLVESKEGELKWVPIKEIFKENLWPSDKLFLPYVFEDKFFSGKFVQEGNEIVEYSLVLH